MPRLSVKNFCLNNRKRRLTQISQIVPWLFYRPMLAGCTFARSSAAYANNNIFIGVIDQQSLVVSVPRIVLTVAFWPP